MPTYDYKCTECNYSFEEFQKMSDEQLVDCPECSGKLNRLIGAGITPIFKGSGFYQTDYKNAPAKKTTNSAVDSAPKTTETKKETKSE